MKKIGNFKSYRRTRDIDSINVDFVEQLARSVVDTTISKVVLANKGEFIPPHWIEATKKIVENNDIERLMKTDTRHKSMYGKSYVGFDMYKGNPILWIAPYDFRNQAIRLNGMEQYAVRVRREYSAANQAPILTNEVVYTKETMSYLFLGGFGVGNINTINQKNSSSNLEQVKDPHYFPFDWVSIKTPDYIMEQHKQGTFPNELGVLPVREMLNKDVADYGDDHYLSDWYPAKEYIPMIDAYLNFIAWELQLDHTRIMGMFSFQDLEGIKSNASSIAKSNDPASRLQQAMENFIMGNMGSAFDEGGDLGAIQKKLVVKTIGSEGSALEKMNTTFDGNAHFTALEQLITLIYDICGYSWNSESDSSGSYENVSQTQKSLRSVYETTKEKNELFTRQWIDLLKDIYFVVINQSGFSITKEDIEKEFDMYVHFEIVSNIILSQSNDWRKNMELKQSKMLSLERAIKLTWPELSDEDVKKEAMKIQKEQALSNPFMSMSMMNNEKEEKGDGQFDNEKPFQSSPFNKGEERNE